MTNISIVVQAREGTANMIAKGMLASVNLDLVDTATGKSMFNLSDAVVRMNRQDGSFYLSPPSRQVQVDGNTKYFRYWRIFPNDRDQQDAAEKWVLQEVEKALGPLSNLAQKIKAAEGSGFQAPSPTPAPFGGGSSAAAPTPAPFGAAIEKSDTVLPNSGGGNPAADFPFGG